METIKTFLYEVEKSIKEKSDYKANYSGDRKYFGGRKILNKPVSFVFGCNSKKSSAVISLESKEKHGSKLIKDLYIDKKDELYNLNYKIDLSKGVKSKEWTRLELLIEVDNFHTLLDYIDEYIELFLKYKAIVEDYIINKKSTWIFQGNPKYEQDFDFNKDLVEGEIVSWNVKKQTHVDNIKPNDDVYIWRSDGNEKGSGGIVAYGRVVEFPYETGDHHSVDIIIKEVRLTEEDNMLKRTDIKEDVILSELLIVRQPNGTNYKLEDYESDYIKAIWDGKKEYKRIEDARYWAMSLGEDASYWEECENDDEILIGWEYLGNLSNYKSKDEINQAIIKYENRTNDTMNDTLAIYQFLNDMKIGDFIIAKQGEGSILGYGVVISDYIYYEDKNICTNSRKVKWLKTGKWSLKSNNTFPIKVLTDITSYPEFITDIFDSMNEEVVELIGEEIQVVEDDILKDVFIEESKIEDIILNLDYKKNIILQGPPGVGKTFVAKKICYLHQGYICKDKIEMVQFHQSYSYEDFIRGYRPDKNGGFTLKDGVFYKFTQKAINDPNNNYYFIIDEINRGNLSKIFGELMMLIEKDKRGEDYAVSLTYQEDEEKFYIPENLYIIGTMNTADRSLSIVDYALRRRFAFIDIEPAFDNPALRRYFKKYLGSDITSKIITKISTLNKIIEKESLDLGKGYKIGHSYFTPSEEVKDVNRWYKRIVKMEIEPLIREYWFDKDEDEIKLKVDDLLED